MQVLTVDSTAAKDVKQAIMPQILEDAARKPDVFCWFGAIPAGEIEAWTERVAVHLPSDLLDFWRFTGGGDAFESETILRPNVTSRPNAAFVVGDDTDSANNSHRASGMPEYLFLFGVGLFLSAVDLRTARYVTFSPRYSIRAEYASFEDWYLHTLRAEFGQRYGLEPIVQEPKTGL